MLIVDKDTRRGRHDGQEGEHHFHARDEGIARRDREAEQWQTVEADPACLNLAIREGDANALTANTIT